MNKLEKLVYICIAINNGEVTDHTAICGHFQLGQDLFMDSLDRVELLMELEEMCDVEFLNPDICDNWFIVDDVLEAVKQAGGI